MALNYIIPDNYKKFAQFIDKLKKAKKSMGVQIGIVKNARGIDKRTGKPKKITVAEEGFYNCMGVPEKNIPPRNYQKKVIEDNMSKWKEEIRHLLKKRNTYDTCEIMGIVATEATKRTIDTWKNPPNAPMTVAIKGKNTPLVDFGDLLKGITYKVMGFDEADK